MPTIILKEDGSAKIAVQNNVLFYIFLYFLEIETQV